MKIKINETAARHEEQHPWLDRIIARVDDGWHIWDVSRLERFPETSWVTERGTAGQRIIELYQKSVAAGAWRGAIHRREIVVTGDPESSDEFTPEAAARFAEEPFTILVENRISDGAFLEKIIQELDRPLGKYWNQPGRPIKIDSLGGTGQMRQAVESQGRKTPRPRFAVVVDSDRRTPTSAPCETAREIERECEKHGFPCWVLAKREVENYLPRELLDLRTDAGQEHADRVEVWDSLTDDQKDCFDMKNGLSVELSGEEAQLFEVLNDGDRRILSQGFGDNVYKCWLNWENRDTVRAAIRDRGRGDIERGLELLRQGV